MSFFKRCSLESVVLVDAQLTGKREDFTLKGQQLILPYERFCELSLDI